MNEKYKLHSSGSNWFHFRRNPDSMCESFTITYIHDGTVVMSGDYGTLAWRRYGFPKDDDYDYGFPAMNTNIGYFAEKVVQWGVPQKIKDWKSDRAREEIAEYFREHEEEYPDKEKVREFLEDLHFSYDDGEYGMVEMIDQLHDFDRDNDWTDGHVFGEGYSEGFIFRYELLKLVSEQILEEVRRRKGNGTTEN